MAKSPLPDAEDSAEKAYAAAAETSPKFTPKDKRPAKAAPAAKKAVTVPSPAAKAKPPVAKAKPAALPALPPVEDVPALPSFKAKPAKPALPEPVAATPPAPIVTPEPVVETPAVEAPAIAAAEPHSKPNTAPVDSDISQLKDKTMNAQTNDFTSSETFGGIKSAFSDVKAKAKAAFDKGTASIGDATEFAKGNVEAVVESGKIYAAGLQEMGSSYVAEGKTAFETMTADVKELAAQKTPVDFFKLQGELAKKNFESAVAFGSKSSEAWLKLTSEAFAPLSGRMNLAVEKIKAAA